MWVGQHGHDGRMERCFGLRSVVRKGAVGFDYGTARWEGEDRKIRTNRLTGPNAGQKVSVFPAQAGGYRFSRTTGQIETIGYVAAAFFGRLANSAFFGMRKTFPRPMLDGAAGDDTPGVGTCLSLKADAACGPGRTRIR